MNFRFPKPLQRGATIGVTAPSSGCQPWFHKRLDAVLQNLLRQGFKVVEGECLRQSVKNVSAPAKDRAREFMQFWQRPDIDIIIPPWGGEVLVETFAYLDWNIFQNNAPKWFMGYSDISTLLFALSVHCNVGTAHGTNLLEMVASQTDNLSNGWFDVLSCIAGNKTIQQSSPLSATIGIRSDFINDPEAPFVLGKETHWKSLKTKSNAKECSGRLIGGCLDTIGQLTGSLFSDLKKFKDNFSEPLLVYLENCEFGAGGLTRALWNLKLAGWFDGVSGVALGRSAVADPKNEEDLNNLNALQSVFSDAPFPVFYDLDIGHVHPQMTLVNGALARIKVEDSGKGFLEQMW